MTPVTANELSANIKTCFEAGLVPAVWGSPGIGKSDIMRDVARDMHLELIDFRLSQCDPTDLNGIPDRDNGRLVWLPPKLFPLEHDQLPAGKKGWLLFLDEVNSAGTDVQKAAYKLILDRMVGKHRLHADVHLALAGNLQTDRALVNDMPSPLKSRMIHFELAVDSDQWVTWALLHALDERIIGFLRFRPALLHDFNPQAKGVTYPCPRTWHFVSKLLKTGSAPSAALLAGAISEGPAVEFSAFMHMIHTLPSFDDIYNKPMDIPVPEAPDMRYALASMFINKLAASNVTNLMKYIERMPTEYQFFIIQNIKKLKDATNMPEMGSIHTKYKGVIESKEVNAWMIRYANDLL